MRIDAVYRDVLEGVESERHGKFAAACKKFGCHSSLNTGKRLMGAVKGSLQGGTLDDEKGVFHSAPETQASLIRYGFMLLSQERVSSLNCGILPGKHFSTWLFEGLL